MNSIYIELINHMWYEFIYIQILIGRCFKYN
jgi:hypothetical protein